MEFVEEVGESSSPPRAAASPHLLDVRDDVYRRLVEDGNDAASDPGFREQLDAHFSRLPPSYALDVNLDRVEDVLLHRKILSDARKPNKRPVIHARFVEHITSRLDTEDIPQQCVKDVSCTSGCNCAEPEEGMQSNRRKHEVVFEPCSKLEDLNLDTRQCLQNGDGRFPTGTHTGSREAADVLIHEIIFSTLDKPKLLSQLSALLSDIGLNIREAHVFSTTDGYSLDVFVVDGWPVEDADGLQQALEKAVAGSEDSWSGSSSHSASERILLAPQRQEDWEIDRRLLKMGEKIASGSCGDLYRGIYLGHDVAIKVIRPEHLNEAIEVEFTQEVMILREVQHRNVVRFVGACTKAPQLCIITEYMPGGNLYDLVHKQNRVLELPKLLKFAIDVSKGMEYLHQNNIIHRDLKTANLLIDNGNVVKVADFGVARFLNQGGIMTAETGTYRWMAPEVINHQPYDQKADVFSFAIVLWELATSKIPYDTMTPLQAALGVRQGLRPPLPEDAHPRLLALMRRCWEAVPGKRPSFSEITSELEDILCEVTLNSCMT
ncbi:serine/threonine-protein kinase STY46-like isoform X2 [Nymphaea colorata]|uniref:serine/threonine-protein kinase STY46-like isoform X2 n=1 Tax=Nymphaea colorata TaxID=210225 RepID=UPI00129D358C|nr:serine/threonine-protein kinase STY46-like isoform X2 [Nymphaea colorata]